VIELADRYVRACLDAFPTDAVSVGAPDAHPDRLPDRSAAARRRWQQDEDGMLPLSALREKVERWIEDQRH
jgi:hypothetical protein